MAEGDAAAAGLAGGDEAATGFAGGEEAAAGLAGGEEAVTAVDADITAGLGTFGGLEGDTVDEPLGAMDAADTGAEAEAEAGAGAATTADDLVDAVATPTAFDVGNDAADGRATAAAAVGAVVATKAVARVA